MKRFRLEQDFLNIFPEAKIGLLVCRGIDNTVKDPEKYRAAHDEAQAAAKQNIQEPEVTQNPVIRTWRDAFYKFKTKKGARSSIEAMLKRVSNGNSIGCINPLVDIYNCVSLRFGVPVGGENIDKFVGDCRLTVADGSEEFVTYGSDKSEPPYPGEIVYKDDAGAICRCFNWRESVRTMLEEDTVNAQMVIETVVPEGYGALEGALAELKTLIEKELGGTVEQFICDAEHPEYVIEA